MAVAPCNASRRCPRCGHIAKAALFTRTRSGSLSVTRAR
ncbi:hypothetical protein [Streptomyces sp. NBC_01320]